MKHRRKKPGWACGRLLARLGALGSLATAAGLFAAVLLEGCGAGASTSGKRVVLHTRAELAPGAATFTTAFGWHVTLERALIAGGPLYYFDGAPPLVQRRSQRSSHFALRLLGLRTAAAHPGHYQWGNALGQMLEPWSVDLLAGSFALADGEGVSGTYRSARFSFSTPPFGMNADALEGHIAVAEGRAEMDGEAPRFFRAIADLEDVSKSAADGNVDGCEFREAEVATSGTVTVVVIPKVWFNLVDFSELESGSASAPAEFPGDSQPKIAFSQGLAQLSAYHFSFQSE